MCSRIWKWVAPVSDEPKPSLMMMLGSWSRSWSLTASLRMAPPLPTTINELVSYLPAAGPNSSGVLTGSPPKLATGGGTSDGRFIAPLGAQVVELGVVNASIHKVNECVRVEDIEALHRMYFNVLKNLLIG